jgi:hypothetical protein
MITPIGQGPTDDTEQTRSVILMPMIFVAPPA